MSRELHLDAMFETQYKAVGILKRRGNEDKSAIMRDLTRRITRDMGMGSCRYCLNDGKRLLRKDLMMFSTVRQCVAGGMNK